MEIKLRRRLIGGAVLVALAIIFIPLLFKTPAPKQGTGLNAEMPPLPLSPTAQQQPVVTVQYNGSSDQPILIRPSVSNSQANTSTRQIPNQVAFGGERISSVTLKKSPLAAKTPLAKANRPGPAASTKVVARANKARVMTTGKWVVQVGIFSNPANVKKLQKELEARNFVIYIRPLKTASNTLTRVLVGPGAQRSKAIVIQARLASELHLKGVVIAFDSRKA